MQKSDHDVRKSLAERKGPISGFSRLVAVHRWQDGLRWATRISVRGAPGVRRPRRIWHGAAPAFVLLAIVPDLVEAATRTTELAEERHARSAATGLAELTTDLVDGGHGLADGAAVVALVARLDLGELIGALVKSAAVGFGLVDDGYYTVRTKSSN
jgi:hypothetical protein